MAPTILVLSFMLLVIAPIATTLFLVLTLNKIADELKDNSKQLLAELKKSKGEATKR